MNTTFKLGRIALGRIALSGAMIAPMLAYGSPAFAAPGDAPGGSVINNTASATYSDGAATPNNYTTLSNTVSTTVQNVPALLIAGTGPKTVAPGQSVTDQYTLTNNGNGTGDFQLTGASTNGGTDAPAVTNANITYIFTPPGGTATSYPTLAALNGALAAVQVPVGGTLTFGEVYTVPTTAGTTAPNNTYTTTPSATITQNGTTSAASTATDTDNVSADARLDLMKTIASSTATAISYTIAAGDGSPSFSAKDLASAETLVGATVPGVIISDKLPQVGGVPLALQAIGPATTSAAAGYLGGTVQFYASTSATGAQGSWVKVGPGAVTAGTTYYYVAAFVSGGTGGFEFGPDGTTAESTPGNVTAAETALSFPLTIAAPTTAGTVTNFANSAIGSNAATETILSPGVPAGTADTPSSTPLTTTNQGINNPTPTTNTAPVNGASNAASTSTGSVLNGPANVGATINSGDTGSFDGVSAINNNDDFTNGVLTGTANASTNGAAATATTPAGSNLGVTATASVTNSLDNTAPAGTPNDTYTLTLTLPAGISVASITRADGVVVTQTGGGTTGTETFNFGALAPQATTNYTVNYNAPATVPTLTRESVLIVATGTLGTADTNNTYDNLYAGFVALFKTQTIGACPNGTVAVAGQVCPGATLTYGVNYRNVATPANGTEAATAVAATQVSKLAITENGVASATNTNSWYSTFAAGPPVVTTQVSNGLNAAPTDTTAGTTYTYTGGTAGVGASAFVATIGGATFVLAPGAQGTVTFAVTIK